jgi:hypothetical protein
LASVTRRQAFAGLDRRRAVPKTVTRTRPGRNSAGPVQADPRPRVKGPFSIVRIVRRSCRASASPATATADRKTDRVSSAGILRPGPTTMAGARGKTWTPGSCSSRMTRRSAR